MDFRAATVNSLSLCEARVKVDVAPLSTGEHPDVHLVAALVHIEAGTAQRVVVLPRFHHGAEVLSKPCCQQMSAQITIQARASYLLIGYVARIKHRQMTENHCPSRHTQFRRWRYSMIVQIRINWAILSSICNEQA